MNSNEDAVHEHAYPVALSGGTPATAQASWKDA
jgi:hypothetical protein